MKTGINTYALASSYANFIKNSHEGNIKKEIAVWVCEGWENCAYPEFVLNPNGKDSEFTVKATLVIEIPEKKIEITESELNEAFKYAWENSKLDDHEGTRTKLKQKLFGENV